MSAVGSISVAQTAISLLTGAPAPSRFSFAPRGKARRVVFTNTGANAIFIGSTSGVTSSAYGLSLAAGASTPVLTVSESDTLYAIATTGTNVVKALWLT